MIKLEQKYTALLGDVQRRASGLDMAQSTARLRLCFEVLGLASAIDGDCATRLGRYGLKASSSCCSCCAASRRACRRMCWLNGQA